MATTGKVHHTPKLHKAAQTLAKSSSTKQQKHNASMVLNKHKSEQH